jgi:hypothetical protein
LTANWQGQRRAERGYAGRFALVRSLLPCFIALLVLSSLVNGCRRKLPGPADCQRIAASMLGIETAAQLLDPRVKFEFDKLTRDCLLTPFDGELVRCIDETKSARQCLYQFQRRRQAFEENVQSADLDAPVRRW